MLAYKRRTKSQLKRFNSTTEFFSSLISASVTLQRYILSLRLIISGVAASQRDRHSADSIGGLRPADSTYSSTGSAAVRRVSPRQSHSAMLWWISASGYRLSGETARLPVVDAAVRADRPNHRPRGHLAYCNSRRSYRTLASWLPVQHTTHTRTQRSASVYS